MGLNPTEKCIPIKAAADTTDAAGRMIVKGNRHLSEMNNRLYRQCRTYDVRFSTIANNVGSGDTWTYDFFTLPNTWFVYGAIKYAYDTYKQAHEDELRAGIRFAKWHDFHINEQDPDLIWEIAQACLFDGGDSSGSLGGWMNITADEVSNDTTVTKNDGSTVMQFNLLGNETNEYNIFSEYANKLKYRISTDPSVSSSQPYEGLLDLKDADLMAEVGDKPPYDSNFSSFLHDGTDDQNILVYQGSISSDANGAIQRTSRTFTAPLGLVWVQKEVNGTLTDISHQFPELCMHFSPGKYKGVRSESLV